MKKANQGIIMSGGTINADQIAVGSNAKAQKIIDQSQQLDSTKSIDDLIEQISNLMELIKDNKNILDSDTEGAIAVVKQEAEKEKPNKFVMTSILEGISAGAKSISSIENAISAVKSLIDIVIQ